MQILLLIPVIFLCLFILYLLSRQDFVLLRQNISLAQVFDLGIISIFFAFFLSRVFFVINSQSFELLNILQFLHIIRYPGLSSTGFLVGGAVALYVLFRKRKGLRRIFDIFAISFMPIFAYYFLIRGYPPAYFYIPLTSLIIMTLLFFFFLKSHNKYILRDGSISYIVLFLIATSTVIGQIFNQTKWVVIYGFHLPQLLGLLLAIFALILLVLNQKIFKS